MQNAQLPPRPSLEYLRKTAKERLAAMRRADPRTQLASALRAVAQEHGFPSWRALKAEVDRHQSTRVARFIAACAEGEVALVRSLLADEPSLIRARDTGHQATGLHFAAASGHVELVRLLLDAGAEPQGDDDVTSLGVIGWATCFPSSGRISLDVVSALLERGVRHHVFSAIAVGDASGVRTLVEQDPEVLDRRMSRREHGQTALHFAISRNRCDMLELLIALGADLEAIDANGQTPLEFAMLRGDRAAVARLVSAGALPPPAQETESASTGLDSVGESIQGLTPILLVGDVAATLRWYVARGFKEVGRYPADRMTVFWGMVSLGRAALMFEGGTPDAATTTLIFATDRIHDQYRVFKTLQLEAARTDIRGSDDERLGVEFVDDLHEPIFGGLQFSIRDCNGYTLRFLQEGERPERPRKDNSRRADAV